MHLSERCIFFMLLFRLIFLFDFAESIKNGVVLDADNNGLFGFACDDTNILWIRHQREMAATFAAIKDT